MEREPEPPPRAERIEPEEIDFDPGSFTAEDARDALAEGVRLFGEGHYHEAHEAFERCWLANEAGDADFYKGLVQAAICMHHLVRGNPAGARKLYSGHRRLLGRFLPRHRGVDVELLLAEMQRVMRPVLRGGERGDLDPRPYLEMAAENG